MHHHHHLLLLLLLLGLTRHTPFLLQQQLSAAGEQGCQQPAEHLPALAYAAAAAAAAAAAQALLAAMHLHPYLLLLLLLPRIVGLHYDHFPLVLLLEH
jgi:hypothetical protein